MEPVVHTELAVRRLLAVLHKDKAQVALHTTVVAAVAMVQGKKFYSRNVWNKPVGWTFS